MDRYRHVLQEPAEIGVLSSDAANVDVGKSRKLPNARCDNAFGEVDHESFGGVANVPKAAFGRQRIEHEIGADHVACRVSTSEPMPLQFCGALHIDLIVVPAVQVESEDFIGGLVACDLLENNAVAAKKTAPRKVRRIGLVEWIRAIEGPQQERIERWKANRGARRWQAVALREGIPIELLEENRAAFEVAGRRRGFALIAVLKARQVTGIESLGYCGVAAQNAANEFGLAITVDDERFAAVHRHHVLIMLLKKKNA
jgi:hypothetical protein